MPFVYKIYTLIKRKNISNVSLFGSLVFGWNVIERFRRLNSIQLVTCLIWVK